MYTLTTPFNVHAAKIWAIKHTNAISLKQLWKFGCRFTQHQFNINLNLQYYDCDSTTTINHAWHFLTRGCGCRICHIINSQTVKNHYNFTLMYYGLPVISLSLGWDIVNFQQLLRLWGKLMIKYRRPDLLVWTLLLPGQCHKDKTFILICLKAKLFHANHIYFLEEESRTWPLKWPSFISY